MIYGIIKIYIYSIYMITLKLIIYSLILFILLVKFSSCKNNTIDLINVILMITLFNLILEKIINTNLNENYDPVFNNNYSSLENNNFKNNNYDYKTINYQDKENKKSKDESENDKKSNDETKNDQESEDIIKNDDKSKDDINNEIKNKDVNKIEQISNTTNKIVDVIKDNVKNIINNNFVNTSTEKREDLKLDNKFIYGYSYLHTDNWSIPEKRKPVCKNINPCKICPNKTNGFNAHLLNYHNISNGK